MNVNLQNVLQYRSEVARLIRDLTTVHYYLNSDGRTLSVLDPLTQGQISDCLGVTYATVSRAATCVSSLSGEAFYQLIFLHRRRLADTLDFNPPCLDLPF